MRFLPLAALVTAVAVNGAFAAETAAASGAKSRTAAPRGERVQRAPAPEVQSGGELPAGQVAYQVLLGEIALRRGYEDLAASAYAELAISSRDPLVLSRAVEVAALTRRLDLAYELAQLWVDSAPDSVPARQALVGVMVTLNRIGDLAPHVAKLLEQDKENLSENLTRLNRLFARQQDKVAVLRLVEQLVAPYAGTAEAQFALAQAALTAGDQSLGLASLRKARSLRPEWELPVLLEAQVLGRESPARAIDLLERHLSSFPDDRDVRLHLARAYVGEKRFKEAGAEFRRLLSEFPDNVDVVYPVAILALQNNDLDTAEVQLKHLLELDFGDRNVVNYYLGQVMEARRNPAEAQSYYAEVGPGDVFVPARSRQAALLAKDGRLDEARQALQQAATDYPSQRNALIQSEAQLLRDAKRYRESLDLLEPLLKKNPDQPDLLYDAAMVADRLGNYELMEERLRRLIRLQPDNANAYNALGYSFAERNTNLDEARSLVARALALAPGDPFIIDSMAWVLYRQGDQEGALVQLRKAYGLRQDPEIAAHLGEVLWALGRQEEARSLLRQALAQFPDNEVLTAVVKKYLP